MEKSEPQNDQLFVSPYLREPLRSWEEAQRERDAKRFAVRLAERRISQRLRRRAEAS